MNSSKESSINWILNLHGLLFVMQVLEKCVHFLSSKSPWLRLLVLDTIDIGVQAISQSEDQLLPMIHRLWPPMVKRFTDDEQVNGMEVFSHYFICFY